ncbi:TetR/AcrR family transcriptional regulator [Nocardia amamiensis]|uniref:TetR/AcrR family transcriptional regulator n=1 Tax=Nocardia TaxID=1817 RepID=UPI0033F1D04F
MSRGDAPERRTQEERRTEAERRLLDAAAELIGEIGPAQLTLAAIGDRAGYSRGLVTHHFGSKGAMMERLVAAVAHRFQDALVNDGGSESALDAVLEFIRTYMAIVADFPPMHRARLVLWADAVSHPSEIRQAMVDSDREFRDELTKRIELGQASGELSREVDPVGMATVAIGMLRGVALQSMLDPNIDLDASRREIEQMLIQRLRPSAESTSPSG